MANSSQNQPHALDMIPVCPTCLEKYKRSQRYTRRLRKLGCFDPHTHPNDPSKWPLAVMYEQSGHLQEVRPVPVVTLTGHFIMCHYLTIYRRGRGCKKKDWCTYAHSKLELKAWNRALKKQTGKGGGGSSQPSVKASVEFVTPDDPLPRNPPVRYKNGEMARAAPYYNLPPLDSLNRSLLEAPVTYDNYQDKFHMLLYYEEHEHERVLKERCNGRYRVATYVHWDGDVHGQIYGMTSANVAYATQAATDVYLILPHPSGSFRIKGSSIYKGKSDDIIYFTINTNTNSRVSQSIAQVCPQMLTQTTNLLLDLEFILKHSYFANNHRSLENLSPSVISKLVPRKEDLELSLGRISRIKMPPIDRLSLDKEYQFLALQKILGCSSNAIFLVIGPFGTGKTRLLATAAYNILKQPDTRVLICTSHIQSADSYIDDYFGPMVEKNLLQGVNLVRLKSQFIKQRECKFDHIPDDSRSPKSKEDILHSRLVVTTLLSTIRLRNYSPRSYTHILIDESAQTREPEAVAPLGLADEHTKIVIAGDHLQVGPQVLVLGEEAQKNGLATSLLLRMHSHYESLKEHGQTIDHLTTPLLTNYRCHDTILRLPSVLFFESTLQARSTSKLHPSCISALEFVCSSFDQTKLHNCPDYDDNELVILLEQVEQYVNNWPVAEWEEKDYSQICVMSPSATQISKVRQSLKQPRFASLQGITTLKSFELQGREFRAVFISTLEATTTTGATMNPTKSICDQYMFNTVITRAQSLVVCVGNPFLLLSIESHYTDQKQCWREYLKRCLEVSSLKIAPQCRDAFPDCQSKIHALYLKVFGDLQSFLASPRRKVDDVLADSILDAYKRAFQSLPACRELKVTLGRIANGDRGYTVEVDKGNSSDEEETVESNDPNSIECYLQCDSYRLSWAIPINPKFDPIKIQGIDNRRQAFDGARVQVSLYKDIERSGYVTKIIEQGPEWQYICTVDEHNSIFFSPIDHKNPRFVNLPGLSRGLLLKAGNVKTIKKELEVRQHSVAVFDPTSFTNPNKRNDDEENTDIEIPQIKDVIPLSIARRLLFVVWHLSWERNRRYPLGVVVAALPRGLTFFHAERLLCTQHNISAPNIKITPEIEAELSAAPTVVGVGNVYNNAIIIEQPDVAFTIEFSKDCKDGVALFVLGVHVANVARFLEMDSAIDQLACHRGTSLRNFGPGDKQHPMLPPSVIKKWSFCCSKLLSAISATCKIRFANGKPAIHSESTVIEESCGVCPNITLSFSEVQQILEKQFSEDHEDFKGDTKESKIGLLYSVAKHLCCKRLQCNIPVFGASDKKEFSHAHFMVNELMVWMNRTIAEYILSKPSLFAGILHKQRKPNISQFVSTVRKHVAVLPYHPLLKMLPQSPDHPAQPFILEQNCFRKLQEALTQKKCVEASEILSLVQNRPQIAVTCKELSHTEPNHEYVCSSLLQPISPLKLDLNSFMVSPDDNKVSPYAHHGLHCLSSPITSPLQSYLDIVAQRLLLNALNNEMLYSYTQEKLTSLCKSCQIKQDSATHCEQSVSQLNLTLSLAECAQPFTVFVGTVKEDSPGESTAQGSNKNTIRKGRLQLVFPDPALHWLEENQCSVTISSIMCGNSKIHFQNGCYKSTWTAKMTSFLHLSSTDFYHEGACHISKGDTTVGDDETKKMVFMVPSSKNDAKGSPLVKEMYTVKHNNPVVSVPTKNWNCVEQFLSSPCENTSVPLLKVLDKLPTVAMSKATLLEKSTEFVSTIKSSSMWLYNGQLSIEPYKVLKVWLSASYTKPLLTPTIQLLEVAPFLNICVQHNTSPASCFASPILSNASKVKYNNIEEYVSLWEDVVLAEASVQSIKEAEMKIIYDVQLKWPALKQPDSSLDDVYFVPDGKIVLCPTDEFLNMSKDFFFFDVGDLVCVRYKVPMTSKNFKDHCTCYGLKDDKGYVVFHMVVYEVGKDVTGVINDIFLKFASPQTTRISAFMKEYLMGDRHCELQLIPLNISHRRVYKSLRSLLSPSHTVNKKLVYDIALGNIIAQGASRVDHNKVSQFKRNQVEPILKLWPLSPNGRLLNDSQLYSIMLAMKNKLQLIQGPPGTGKSVTGAHLAYGFVFNNRSKPLMTNDNRIKCVLVCGPSNKSVDVVLDLLIQLGDPNLRLLRIYGSSIEGKDHVGPYHNKEVFIDVGTDQVCRQDHKPYALHWLVRSAQCKLHRQILDMDREFTRMATENKVPSASSREKYRKIMRQAEDEVFHHGYDIVLCTCNEASSSRVARNIAAVQVIIDEAAMATEPESMVAIKLASEHVTLIGDHMQLQPVIDYQQAADFGLGMSLFERYAAPPQQKAKQSVSARRPVSIKERHFLRLNVQYRMHWRICEFPSKTFYDGELDTDQVATADFIPVKKFWPKGRDYPLAFCNIEGREGGAVSGNKKSSLLSKSNMSEAKKVAEIVEVLHKVKGIPQASIAVLTPYTSQKDVIVNTLRKQLLTGITVQTVTESQGREFGFVILSTVRSQPWRTISNRRAVQPDRKWLLDHLGFVTDKHQICVGITRAKHGLIIVGNKMLLDYDDTWHKLINHYTENGYIKSAKDFPSAEDLRQLRVQ